MRQDSLLASIGGMLRRFKRAEAWLRNAGLPTFFAHVPVWLLSLHYCIMMRGKTARITRISQRIARWLQTITGLSQYEKARTELLDMDGGMRNDLESTKRTLLQLRELCLDVGGMFDSIGFSSAILHSTQETFLEIVDESCMIATTLQRALEMHDTRALALLREMQDAERLGNVTEGVTVVGTGVKRELEARLEVEPETALATELVTELATEPPSTAIQGQVQSTRITRQAKA